MTSQNLVSEEINYQYHKIIEIQVGDYHFQEKIPIICPFEKEGGKSHIITKNGHDSSVKGHPQQYRCKTCLASFYAHTSKNFQQIQENIPDCLVSIFSKGDLTLKKLGIFFNIPYHTTSRLLEAFLRHAAENMWDFTPFYEKMRKSNVLIVDETFLTIDGESWYLIIAISGNNKIMGFCISKSRNFNVMFPFINKCADKLEDGLEILVTDGFRTYQKVAEQWGEDIIHVRHIHKPPYGWAFVDIHHYDNEAWYRVSLRIRNDILVNSNGFLAEVYVKRDYLVYKKDIPKIPKIKGL